MVSLLLVRLAADPPMCYVLAGGRTRAQNTDGPQARDPWQSGKLACSECVSVIDSG